MINLNLEKYGVVQLMNYTDLTELESRFVLDMRNHPEINKWMYDTTEISWVEHCRFIESLKNKKNKICFLVKFNNETIGVINFNQTTIGEKAAEFGLYANPYISVPGVGRILEETSMLYASTFLKVEALKLEVFSENRQVINLHKKYGFHIAGYKSVNNKEVIQMQKKIGI